MHRISTLSCTDDFIVSYMRGRTRAAIDAGQAYVCTMSADGLLESFFQKKDISQKRASAWQKPPRFWIPFPEIWGPVARIVASPFPARAE